MQYEGVLYSAININLFSDTILKFNVNEVIQKLNKTIVLTGR